MPTVSQIIQSIAKQKKVQPYIVEKDYALSYLLAAINQTIELRQNLALKGGTALKKLYFSNYRFSEDLDFSTISLGAPADLDDLISSAVHQMKGMLDERGPFQVTLEPLMLKQPHPGQQKAYTIRVQFPEQRQAFCRLKVEITVDEPVLTPVEIRPILHNFPEIFNATIPAYSLLEITAEKLRALLQSKARLKQRGWGASRVCRDYFDLWNLLQMPETKTPELIPLLSKKCLLRDVIYQSPQEFISNDLLTVAKLEWQHQLLPFVPDALPVEQVLTQVQEMITSIWL